MKQIINAIGVVRAVSIATTQTGPDVVDYSENISAPTDGGGDIEINTCKLAMTGSVHQVGTIVKITLEYDAG